MKSLFEESAIGGMRLRNRFVRSATWEGMAGEDGSVTDRIMDLYDGLARGGVGLIITGHAYVCKEGQAVSWQLGIDEDRLLGGLTALVKTVHRNGAKIAVQLAHAGCRAAVDLTGLEAIGPSVLTGERGQVCRAMADSDFEQVADTFATAARRAERAGFDAVQLHAAHSYLISEFLSPCHNKRDDSYGGPIENRTRFLLEVAARVRDAVSRHLAVLVKINSDDFIDGGFTVDDMLGAAVLLEKAGIDGIELSGGSPFSPKYMSFRPGPIKSEADEVYYREAAGRYKQTVDVPLILPGGIRSYNVARGLVEENIADYVSMSRPLICEPGLINRWRSGDLAKAACVSDNQCLEPLRSGEGLYCVVARRSAGRKGPRKNPGRT
jgi:2,4-dienoyl-CoA reductase-like NADH-dependent reductase (Old Yellow Enzyme family)